MDNNIRTNPEICQLIHHLRGPLTNIKLTHELLLRKKLGEISELQQEMLEQATLDCIKLEELMAQFLNPE